MRIYRHYEDLAADDRGCAVAIGNFDGVHLGHQAVIGEAGEIARKAGAPWAVLTFEPHPVSVFKPDVEPFRLTPMRTKAHHIEALGVDHMVVVHFDRDFAGMEPESFIRRVLLDGMDARHVVCGYDFYFGKGRKGDCRLLLEMGGKDRYGFTCMKPVTDADGEPYSSTRVRDFLRAGNPAAAAAVLGRPFEIEARVERGDERGRTIGFPTANLHLGEYVRPAQGVYAVRAGVDQGAETAWIDGVANWGARPTFDKDDVVLEVHLFDFDDDLYGRHLRVQLVDFIRPERKFDGLDALKAQIEADAKRARSMLKEKRS